MSSNKVVSVSRLGENNSTVLIEPTIQYTNKLLVYCIVGSINTVLLYPRVLVLVLVLVLDPSSLGLGLGLGTWDSDAFKELHPLLKSSVCLSPLLL